ncbi:MAG: hypothetical protein K2N32_00350 [Clostridia bacterium]|nr:hypothetical protein [Clostridia bacterium]
MELVNGLYNIDSKQFADPYNNGIQRFEKLSKYVNMAIKGLGDNTSSAIEVAKALYMIREEKLYENYPIPQKPEDLQKSKDSETSKIPLVERFHDFNAFCKTFFHCGKSTIYNYIALYERFGTDSGQSVVPLQNFNVSQYTYSQLLLMLPLSDSELFAVKPDWTCSQIKKYVKSKKEAQSENSKRLETVINEEEIVEQAEAYEPFLLNNDERRKEFLTTFKRWNKCAEAVILDEKIMIYEIALSVSAKLYAVQSCVNNDERVRLCLFDPSASRHDCFIYDLHSTFSIFSISRECYIVNFLRDRKIKAIGIAKE